MFTYAVDNKIIPLPLSDIRFGGAVSKQADIFFEERVKSDFAKNEIYKETEEQFRLRNDDDKPVGTWRGEFWGKWIISAVRVARYENDEKLKEFIHNAALNLIKTQDDDGYIGSYKNPENVLPCDPELGLEIYGTMCNHNWNVWCRKYTMWGLLEAYELTEDKIILDATIKFANQLIDMLSHLGISISDCGTFNGLPAGSIMKPMLILYRLTEDKKYLDFAISIANDWERPDGRVPNIISNALQMKPVHKWYPEPEKWAKAYEMMSCLDGLIELYRVTGTEKYLTVCRNMYKLLLDNEGNLLFSVGFNDQFAHGAAYANSISEPCDIIHWIRLCSELYKLTGEAEYMNTVELAFYNAFLASSFKDGKWGARGVRSVGRHMVANGQAKMEYSHCCVNNIPRGFLNVAESFVMKSSEGLIINFYSDFSAKCEFADITIGGSYLKDGTVSIKICANKDIRLFLRIPDWSEKTKLNGEYISGKSGYYALNIKSGTTELALEFDMKIVIRDLEEAPEHFPSEDFRVRRFCYNNVVTEDMMTWDKRATLLYGPLLLTKSKLLGNTEEEMFDSETIAGKEYTCEITPIECDNVNYAFNVRFINKKGGSVEMKMCDYASGTNIASYDDMKLFNIFI